MSIWLPLALLALLVVLLTTMPWHRPQPNHQFMLELLRLLADEPSSSPDSSATGPQAPPGRAL
jgi:hypothetical protein